MRIAYLAPVFLLAGCNGSITEFVKDLKVTDDSSIIQILSVDGPVAGTYETGGVDPQFTVKFSEPVTVTGNPRIPLTVGTQTKYATYVSGSGTMDLIFAYDVQNGDVDIDGLEIDENIDLNGASIKGATQRSASLYFTAPTINTIKIGSKVMSLDFAASTFTILDITKTAISDVAGWTFTRASVGYAQQSNGQWKAFASHVPRITDQGILIEAARTNKCTNFNANPTNTTNVTLSGDAAATISVIDDSAALAAAGLSEIAVSGAVYRLDNSLGVAEAVLDFAGQAGATTAHYASIYVRGGSGRLASSGTTIASFTANSAYTRVGAAFTPPAVTRTIQIRASAGQTLFFILNQFEDASSMSSPIVVAGSSATRAADDARITGLSFSPEVWTQYAYFQMDSWNSPPLNRHFVNFGDGTAVDNLSLFRSTTNRLGFQVFVAGPKIYEPNRGSYTGARIVKTAARFNGSEYNWAADNSLGPASTPVALFTKTLTHLFIGQSVSGTGQMFGYFKKWEFYQTSKTDVELQALTQ